jgi:hypothetical protein
MTPLAGEQPFQLHNSFHDPLGTVREERLVEGVNIWVLEEVPDRIRNTMHRRWRCVYAVGSHSGSMVGEILSIGRAIGFVPTGGVPGTPAQVVWERHVSRETSLLGVVSAEMRAEMRELVKQQKWMNAIKVLREKTGWPLDAAREYVTQLRIEMARDAQIIAAADLAGQS